MADTTEEEKKARAEAAKKAAEEAEAKAKTDDQLTADVKALGIKTSDVKMSGFKDKGNADKVDKEQVRQNGLVRKRNINRVKKAKAAAEMTPATKRANVLKSRLRAVKSRKRANTYTDANIGAWLEELDMIERNPKSWAKLTTNGTKGFTAGNKKKKTARDILDGMDLD